MIYNEHNLKYSFLQTSGETNKEGVPIVICKSEIITKPEAKSIIYRVFGDNTDYYGEIILKHNNEDKPDEAEVEYYASYEYRNKGNISTALNIVLGDAFNNYDINNIYLNIPPSNSASQRVAQKCGFKQRKGSSRYFDMAKTDFKKKQRTK